jgi:hypothetical protein
VTSQLIKARSIDEDINMSVINKYFILGIISIFHRFISANKLIKILNNDDNSKLMMLFTFRLLF